MGCSPSQTGAADNPSGRAVPEILNSSTTSSITDSKAETMKGDPRWSDAGAIRADRLPPEVLLRGSHRFRTGDARRVFTATSPVLAEWATETVAFGETVFVKEDVEVLSTIDRPEGRTDVYTTLGVVKALLVPPTSEPQSESASSRSTSDRRDRVTQILQSEKVRDVLAEFNESGVIMQLRRLRTELPRANFVDVIEVRSVSEPPPPQPAGESDSPPKQLGIFTVEEFAPLGNIAALCGHCSEDLAEAIFLDVTFALAALHQADAVHLNLHAGNVLQRSRPLSIGDKSERSETDSYQAASRRRRLSRARGHGSQPTDSIQDGSGSPVLPAYATYALSGYGWGPLWGVLSAKEREALTDEISVGQFPPEYTQGPLTQSPVLLVGSLNHDDPRAGIEASGTAFEDAKKFDIWALGCLLHRIVFGKEPFVIENSALRESITSNVSWSFRTVPEVQTANSTLAIPEYSAAGWKVTLRWQRALQVLLAINPAERVVDLRAVAAAFASDSSFDAVTIHPPPGAVSTIHNSSGFNISSNSNNGGLPDSASPRSTGAHLRRLSQHSAVSDGPGPRQDSFNAAVSRKLSCVQSCFDGTFHVHVAKLKDVSPLSSCLLEENVPEFSSGTYYVDEHCRLRCTRCNGDLAPMAFICKSCTDFVVCGECFVESEDVHDPTHVIETFVVENVSEEKLERSMGAALMASPSPRSFDAYSFGGACRGSVSASPPPPPAPGESTLDSTSGKSLRFFLSTNMLSSHESTVFGMTGRLPETPGQLDALKRKKSIGKMNMSSTTIPELSPRRPAAPARSLMKEGDADADDPDADQLAEECYRGEGHTLSLCTLKLTELPARLMDVEHPFLHLASLDLSNNQLQALPAALFATLSGALKTLLLGNNQISAIPEDISRLVNLQHLELHRNRLRGVPPSALEALRALKHVSLDDNQLTEIPAFIWSLPSLTTVYLAINGGISAWPPEASIEEYLRRRAVENPDSPELELGLDNHPGLWRQFRDSSFEEEYPALKVVWNKIYPDEVLPGFIYLGALRSAQSPAVYRDLKIGSVLTVGRGLKPLVEAGMRHCTVVVDDVPGASIVGRFDEAFDFINNAPIDLPEAPGVLIHCFAGLSRSATCAIAYLMKTRGTRMDDAYLEVKRARQAIYPNDGFLSQLVEYDKTLFPNADRPLDMASLGRVEPIPAAEVIG